MYEASFQLDRRPFAATPDPECVAEVPSFVRALGNLERTLAGDAGLSVLTSPAGLGKTLLCLRLTGTAADDLRVAYVPSANFATRRALLQSLLYELGRPYANRSEQELRLMLSEALREIGEEGGRAVLILDEAHLLPGRMLEELRLLTLEQAGPRPLASVLLVGQLELEETLAEPGMEAVNQRIRCQAILEPLTRDESRAYVAHRVRWAGGWIDECFDADALRLVCQVADGNPRALNQLCDHTLLLAHVDGRRPVDAACVTEAYEDLRQLPLHWNAPIVLGSTSTDPTPEPVADPEINVRDGVPESTSAAVIIEPTDSEAAECEPSEAVAVEVGWDSPPTPPPVPKAAPVEPPVVNTPVVETPSPTVPPIPFKPAAQHPPEPPVVPVQEPPTMPVFQSRQTVSVLDCFDDPVVWIEEPVVDPTGCRLERRTEPTARPQVERPVTERAAERPIDERSVVEPTPEPIAPPSSFELPAELDVPVAPLARHPEPSEVDEVASFETPAVDGTEHETEADEPAWIESSPGTSYETGAYETRSIETPTEEAERVESSALDAALPMLESALGSIVGTPGGGTPEHEPVGEATEVPADDVPLPETSTPEPPPIETDDVSWRNEVAASDRPEPIEEIEERIQRELSDIVAETSRAVTGEAAPEIRFEAAESIEPPAEPAYTEPACTEPAYTEPDYTEPAYEAERTEYDVVEPESSAQVAEDRLTEAVAATDRPYARLFSEIRREWKQDSA